MKLSLKILIIIIISSNYSFGQKNKDFLFEIPYDKDSSLTLSYRLTKQKVGQLQLENFDNGIDSIGIRIWFNYCSEVTDFRELIEIKFSDSIWLGFYYPMKIPPDDDYRTLTITASNKISIIPKSGWDTYISKLINLEIMLLPLSYDIILEKKEVETGRIMFTVVYDGPMYIIEIATPSMYRFYEYYAPSAFVDVYSEAKKMVNILNMTKSEFNVFDKKFRLRRKMIKRR